MVPAIVAGACGGGASSVDDREGTRASSRTEAPIAVARPPSAARGRIVVLGDSLTAGLGLGPEQSFPVLLQRKIDSQGLPYEVVNAGVSGDTSAGGLRRLDWVLEGDVRILILALGGNDGLRGLPAEALEANLAAIIERCRAADVDVLLAGMEAPPNLGAEYTLAFRRVYSRLAEAYDLPLVPFLLAGVAGVPRFNQPDGIHPNVEGTRMVADLIWEALLPMLLDEEAKGSHQPAAHPAGS